MSGLTFKGCLMLALLSLCTLGGKAQNETLITGVESLSGINPMNSSYWETNTDTAGYHNNAADKTLFLYNVGTGKFLNMGGAWGTHAAMHTTPKYFFLFNNVSGESTTNPTKLNLRTKQSTTKSSNYMDPTQSTDYMQYIVANSKLYNPVPGLYFDRSYNNVNGGSSTTAGQPGSYGWSFEKGRDNSADNLTYRIYQVVGGTKRYLVAQAADSYGNDVEAVADTTNTNDNKEWKLISLGQYYTLFNQAPADLSKPTDASFLLKDPDFSVNNKYFSYWHQADGGSYVFGTANFQREVGKTSVSYKNTSGDKDFQLNNGRYLNAMIHSNTGEVWQGVTVTKPGWFLFRCRGISNVNAVLYAEQCTDATFKTPIEGEYSSQELNSFPSSVLSATDKMLQAGKEFAQGKYENQVMLYIQPNKDPNAKYYIRFGIKVGDETASPAKGTLSASTTAATTETMTIFDTFRMLYAGKSEEPELILDEDNTDLYYLTPNEHAATGYTKPVDTYTNTTLHLKRTFTLDKWNTIVLPVSLTYRQMKNAFGDDMKLAYLWQLSDNTIRFLTVEPESDDDTMLVANRPYIIYPTKGPGASQAYTATLHHVEKTSSVSAVAWEGTYQGNTVTDGKITIAADHYQIDKVSLVKDSISKDTATWISPFSFTAEKDGKGTMINYGTLAKTYSGTQIITGRNDCHDSYIMKNGAFYLVPSNKQYGLKAFRTWFSYVPDGTAAKPTTLLFSINGITDTTTGIADIFADDIVPTVRATAPTGVYSLSGQKLRSGTDVSGLPSGIYIVNGKKYFVR